MNNQRELSNDELMKLIAYLDTQDGRVSPNLQQYQNQINAHPQFQNNQRNVKIEPQLPPISNYPVSQNQYPQNFNYQPEVSPYYPQNAQSHYNQYVQQSSPIPRQQQQGFQLSHEISVPSPTPSPAPSPALPVNQFQTPPSPNLSVNQDSGFLLDKITQYFLTQKESLDNIKNYQKQLMLNPQKQAYEVLDYQQTQLKQQIESEIKTLQQLYTQKILQPSEIQQLKTLLQDLKLQQTQLEVYHQELLQLTQQNPSRCVAALVITKQPFPMVITKGKQLDDDAIVVQLLSGTSTEFTQFSKMKVVMVWENNQSKSGSQKSIENDSQAIDTIRRTAKWHLKFLNGTRKNSVTLRFGMQIQVSQGNTSSTITVESHTSQPFIVITNECQWEESEGVLLRKEAFGEQVDIPWPLFANVLQHHFIRATRQDAVRPTRCLSNTDLEYIHEKFFNFLPMVPSKLYDNFWSWFGKTVKKLRYQRHILPLWQTGLIHGFLSREAVQEILRQQESGTFLIRFSESNPGEFAVAYRIDDGGPDDRIRHYLIRPDIDTPGNKKTIPDFINEQHAFCYLLQVGVENQQGGITYRKFRKESVLEPYLSKKMSVPPATGYDTNVLNRAGYEMDPAVMDAE